MDYYFRINKLWNIFLGETNYGILWIIILDYIIRWSSEIVSGL